MPSTESPEITSNPWGEILLNRPFPGIDEGIWREVRAIAPATLESEIQRLGVAFKHEEWLERFKTWGGLSEGVNEIFSHWRNEAGNSEIDPVTQQNLVGMAYLLAYHLTPDRLTLEHYSLELLSAHEVWEDHEDQWTQFFPLFLKKTKEFTAILEALRTENPGRFLGVSEHFFGTATVEALYHFFDFFGQERERHYQLLPSLKSLAYLLGSIELLECLGKFLSRHGTTADIEEWIKNFQGFEVHQEATADAAVLCHHKGLLEQSGKLLEKAHYHSRVLEDWLYSLSWGYQNHVQSANVPLLNRLSLVPPCLDYLRVNFGEGTPKNPIPHKEIVRFLFPAPLISKPSSDAEFKPGIDPEKIPALLNTLQSLLSQVKTTLGGQYKQFVYQYFSYLFDWERQYTDTLEREIAFNLGRLLNQNQTGKNLLATLFESHPQKEELAPLLTALEGSRLCLLRVVDKVAGKGYQVTDLLKNDSFSLWSGNEDFIRDELILARLGVLKEHVMVLIPYFRMNPALGPLILNILGAEGAKMQVRSIRPSADFFETIFFPQLTLLMNQFRNILEDKEADGEPLFIYELPLGKGVPLKNLTHPGNAITISEEAVLLPRAKSGPFLQFDGVVRRMGEWTVLFTWNWETFFHYVPQRVAPPPPPEKKAAVH